MTLLWLAPKRFPELRAGEVHVWEWDLDETGLDHIHLRKVLSKVERARADRLVLERDSRRFTVAHARLRQIIGRYVRQTPESIRFFLNAYGKPRLGEAVSLNFNFSHSGDLALLAVAQHVEVGADVECIRPVCMEVTERFFTPVEKSDLDALPLHARLEGFYIRWTAKEAFLKALGVGLLGNLDGFTVCAPENESKVQLQGVGTSGWMLERLSPASGYIGALAYHADLQHLRRFAFTRTAAALP